jgi:hypothetical protein
MTLVELVIGLVITGMVATAVGSLVTAVGSAWQAGDATTAEQMGTFQAETTLDRQIRPARYVGLACGRSGTGTNAINPSVLFWRVDDDGDTFADAYEITLLEQDPATATLRIWTLPASSADGRIRYTVAAMANAANLATFKKLRGCASTVLLTGVTAANFAVCNGADASQGPSIEYTLTLSRGGQTKNLYGTVTLRAPGQNPK